jgi:hypothetical protein
MPMLTTRVAASLAAALFLAGAAGCASSDPETAASPVQSVTRTSETIRGAYGDVSTSRGADGSRQTKILAPGPKVWDALVAAMEARKVKPTILDRSVGRIGDTSMVFLRRWNDKPGSYYFNCGSTMTGQRADDDRMRSVLLAQLSRLPADTVAVVVHFSAVAQSLSSGNVSQCISTGRGEQELLDDVAKRVALAGV